MDKEYIRTRLPVDPPDGLVQWARDHQSEELGPEFMVWNSELVSVEPDMAGLMENKVRYRRQWMARLECTHCGGELITMKIPGAEAVRLWQGDDGVLYELIPGETELTEECGIYDVFDGETFNCPHCFQQVELIHAKKVKGGRTKRFLVAALQVIDGYMAIVYYLAYRTVDEFALNSYGATPADAFVLDENGRVHRYTRIRRGGAFAADSFREDWTLCRDNGDTISKPYNDWRSICNRKVGGDLWPVLPELEGTTGEKTGMDDYLTGGGWWPISYLKLWKKFPAVENICRSPHVNVITGIVGSANRYSYDVVNEARQSLDLEQKKPNRMLRISKEDYRELQKKQICLDLDKLQNWKRYLAAGGKEHICNFLSACVMLRKEGVSSLMDLMEDYRDCDIPKLLRYLEKQNMQPWEITYLLDTRRMTQRLTDRPLYPEELWPRRLLAAHERCTRMLRERDEADRIARRALEAAQEKELDGRFVQIREELKGLLWTDGDLCVVLPESSEDLHREGDVLRHCVGGYSKAHVSGADRIFFVRRYRRPERSYYTLDISMTGVPYEKQLHGYGNERHGLHKEHRHSIPKKVRAFCDRWKAEVLMPWYEEKCKQEAKTA